MFNKYQEEYLLNAINKNDVILFLGSGFPRLAKNKLGEPMPLAGELAVKLWNFLDYEDNYDGTSLDELFDVFVSRGVKRDIKDEFLKSNLIATEVSNKYKNILSCYWYKIYTTNVDNVLDNIYSDSNVDKLIYPHDHYKERDQLLNNILHVYLHGKLPCNPDDLVFSKTQYVDEKLETNYLYTLFVLEYISKPVIFLGTSLNEPLIDFYLRARNRKSKFRERRPKSFLISPSASPVKIDNLEKYNIEYIKADAEDFLDWIEKNKSKLLSREQIIKHYYPNVLHEFDHGLKNISQKSLSEFFKSFKSIHLPLRVKPNYRSGFLMGASPEWSDIQKELDIKRDIQEEVLNKINSYENLGKIQFLLITGSAGTGKSTFLKRIAHLLTQEGTKCFFSYSEYLPEEDDIFNVLQNTNGRAVLLFDNGENVLKYLDRYISSFVQLEHPPIIIVGIRSYFIHYLNSSLKKYCEVVEYNIDELSIAEIRQIIEKLDDYGRLGKLKGLSQHVRENIFQRKSKKQLLVAMREATSGDNFNLIIKDEFKRLADSDSRLIYICIALNTELGFTVSLRDIISFSNVIPNEALDIVENRLRGIIKKGGIREDQYMIRHKVIAEYALKFCATSDMLRTAYKLVLKAVAPEIMVKDRSKRKFTLYKRLISHNRLYSRFQNHIDHARDVYDSIQEHFNQDYHYWLQYGSLETEGYGGNLELAENYLNQADSLFPNNSYVLTSKANLYYKIANKEDDMSKAIHYKVEADDTIDSIIEMRGDDDPYPIHIYCRGNLNWILNNENDRQKQIEKLRLLEDKAKLYTEKFPFDSRLEQLSKKITRNKLSIVAEEMPTTDIKEDVEYDIGIVEK